MPPNIQETLTNLNWVDIMVIVIMLACCYKGSQKGLVMEIFKLLGWVVSLYVSLHYFSMASDFLVDRLPMAGVIFSDFICFSGLSILSYLSVVALRGVFCRMFKVEAISSLERWGAMAVGFFRGILAVSMLLIVFHLSTIPYLKASINKSYLGSRLALTDVRVYEAIFNGLISKFSPDEKINADIYEVLEE